MNALVISNSLVVLELFKMSMNKKNIDAEYVNSAKTAKEESYSAIFIDDSLEKLNKEIDFIKDNFDYNDLIIIGKDKENSFSYQLKKPFLTGDIEELLDELIENESDLNVNAVLDLNEIEKIKALMELTESEEESKELDYKKKIIDKESFKAKNNEAKKVLKELCKMDKKRIKKLFKEAKVSIKISFKDNNE